MEKIRVHVNGALGRMGSLSAATLRAAPEFEVVGTSDRGDNLTALLSENRAQVVVDFTVATVAFENAKLILEAGARPVIGTSGLKAEEVTALQRIAQEQKIGGVIAPNFALGAILLMKFAAEAARYLPACEIIELHHDQKQDAPSGTAVKTAAIIAAARQGGSNTAAHAGCHELFEGARGALVDNVPVHSVRLPGLLAHQEVLFGSTGQLLTLRHDSFNRDSFMSGVVLACRKAPELDSLVYGLEHLL